MEAAGDVGDRDVGHQAYVVADFVKTEALTHVAVDRDRRVSRRRHAGYPFVLILARLWLNAKNPAR
jgi:hypothetical protein